MKNKKLFAILTLVCFMFTLMPVAAFADTTATAPAAPTGPVAQGVLMPKAGITVEECIITEWLKKPGDQIAVGDILFTYETDKATFECESTAAGTLLEIFYNDGDEVPVLVNVCAVGNPGASTVGLRAGEEAPAAAPAAAPAPATSTVAPAAAPVAAAPAPVANVAGEQITAPMPGTVMSVKVSNGQAVKKGDILMIADLEAIKAATEECQKSFYAISEKLYAQQPQDGAPQGAPADDGVVDADYEVVDDNK